MDENKINTAPGFVIVVGASAGGLSALKQLLGQFESDIPAAILVVLHISPVINEGFIPGTLQSSTSLKVLKAENNLFLETGCIYVAVPDAHLLVKENYLLLGFGPEENRWKPSIDVLFRSAAVAYGERCIGIILTGLLNDGTAGMDAIKRCGGVTIIQDPKQAEFPEMPLSVLENIHVDYCLTLDKMAPAVQKIFQKEVTTSTAPKEILAEAAIIEKMQTGSYAVSQIGDPTVYACPDCGGILWEIKNGEFARYRCHIGHSYTEEDLLLKQTNAMHSTLWISLRIMEERKSLLEKIARQNRQKGYNRTSKEYELKAAQLEQHINKMKGILTDRVENQAEGTWKI
ncbi:MAG: hypothetical protein JWM28_1298 [Chitinophagaceae bacterium]|nr:hypothetical protein [Chitinophagaceae bacterium]